MKTVEMGINKREGISQASCTPKNGEVFAIQTHEMPNSRH